MRSWFTLLILSTTLQAGELPVSLRNAVPPLQPLGSATLRWFGLHVYDIALYDEQPPYAPSDTVVLSIRYRVSIKHHRLVETTVKEWRRLGQGTTAQHEQWRRQLDGMWPDVKNGDSLTAFKRRDGPTQFYFGDRLLGEVADPAFGPAFFAIWLHEKSRYPTIRDELLGVNANEPKER
jgi:hypothetical protein